ncbi:tRNA pseudouridine(38-40) synthase TruA [Mongoliitalea daihaiensis]|uniref:tRNA pseudouridine(38-40) synthase TruA n=1 Tax=Mongoliitalea daihaiensis TaxID=2782006 RepID=UPI001F37D420|nr:tRNA pseudouridine(38-40) synthase TruA [Mongoliitalea daihaiensis]UJP65489.1 tRNA pseudouridine(38-40) synthase TruA [Mongoliitalea daihaiensis]
MQNKPFIYRFPIQYLGLRYAGWAKQNNAKTVQGTLERCIRYVLGHEQFRTLGASRTDAGVSANQAFFCLYVASEIENIGSFHEAINRNLPPDIRVGEGRVVDASFNIIQDVASKEYHYHVAYGEKFHPFHAGTLSFFPEDLAVEEMKEAIKIFIGKHDFRRFCSADKVSDSYEREILHAEVLHHPLAGIDDFPKKSLLIKLRGAGFLRYQIRIMVQALVDLGAGKVSKEGLKDALKSLEKSPITQAAPANGLVLFKVEFKT